MGRSSQNQPPPGGSIGLNFNPPSFPAGSSERQTQGSVSKCLAGWKTQLPAGQILPSSSADWTLAHYPFGAHGQGASRHGGGEGNGAGGGGLPAWVGPSRCSQMVEQEEGCHTPKVQERAGARPELGKASWELWVGCCSRRGVWWGSQHRRRLTEGTRSPLIFKGSVSGVGGGGLVGLGGCSGLELE